MPTFDEARNLANTRGAEGLDMVNNPSKFYEQARLNNPLANMMLQGNVGFQAGAPIGQQFYDVPGAGSDIAAALAGGAAGAQRMEDMAPLSAVSPILAESFPEVAQLPAKQAYELMTKMQNYFTQKGKVDDTERISAVNVPYVESVLRSKKYEESEIPGIINTLIGRPIKDLDKIAPKSRLARAEMEQGVIPDDFGIPVKFLETDKITGRKTEKESKTNIKVSQNLSQIGKGKQILDELYKEMFALTDGERQELAAASRVKGGILTMLGRPGLGNETAERVKNIKNIIEANIPLIARSLGHTGVLTELDVIKSFGVTPEVTQSYRELEYRKSLVDKLIGANVYNTIKSATPLLGQGIDYETLSQSMNLPIEYLQKTAEKKASAPQAANDFSDDAFSNFMKGKK